MLLSSFDGAEIEIQLYGHRWPNLEGGRQTLFWLKVNIRASASFGSTEFREPCLLDWEVEELLSWLQNIAADRDIPTTLTFIEGTLAFELVEIGERIITIRVHILHSLETWSIASGYDRHQLLVEFGGYPYVDLVLSRNQLGKAAHELQKAFDRLPVTY